MGTFDIDVSIVLLEAHVDRECLVAFCALVLIGSHGISSCMLRFDLAQAARLTESEKWLAFTWFVTPHARQPPLCEVARDVSEFGPAG